MQKTFLTCAVTGNRTTPQHTPYLPITPEQIADDALAAAEAGAAIVHIHVRDPVTAKPSMEVDLYSDVMKLIRNKNRDVIINLTTGPGGRFTPSDDNPRIAAPGSTLIPPEQRVEHIRLLKPDICSLDLNTMNSGSDVVINTPKNVRKMARVIREAGVMPELEIFDTGDIHLARDMIADGSLPGPGLWTFVTGVKYGFTGTAETLIYARNLLPPNAVWSALGIGREEFPVAAQAWLLGGHVRVGIEDNVYLAKGVLAKGNAELVTKARLIITELGGALMTAQETRELLGLAKKG